MRRSIAFLLVAAFLWGTTFPAIDYGLLATGVGPFTFAALRFLVATVAIVGLAVAQRRWDASLLRESRMWVLAVLNAAGLALQFAAQERTTASKTSLLVDIDVVAVALLGYFLLRERHGGEMVAALGLGSVGVVVLATNGNLETVRWTNREFVGDVLAFGAGLVWAFYFVLLKSFLVRRPGTNGIALTACLFPLTTLLLLPLALVTEGVSGVGDARAWALVVYLGIFPSVLAFYLWQEALRTETATATAVLLLLEIVVALGISVAFLGERLSGAGVVGAVLIVAAAALASRTPPVRPRAQVPLPD